MSAAYLGAGWDPDVADVQRLAVERIRPPSHIGGQECPRNLKPVLIRAAHVNGDPAQVDTFENLWITARPLDDRLQLIRNDHRRLDSLPCGSSSRDRV